MPRGRKRKCLARVGSGGDVPSTSAVTPEVKSTSDTTSGVLDSWQHGKSLTESLLHCYDNQVMCDVTFNVGEERTLVQAHRLVLCVRSLVFEIMLTGPMAEQENIIIPEIEHSIFDLFMRFLYTDEIDLDCNNVIALLYVSNKYDVKRLQQKCVAYLSSSITSENACLVLEQAHLYGEQELKEQALTYIWKHGESSLEPTCITNLCQSCIVDVIHSDKLQASEERIFESLMTWSTMMLKKEGRPLTPENRRDVLGEAVMKIRYPILAQTYLVKSVSPTKILTDSEENRIYKFMLCPDEDCSPFITKHRDGMDNKDFITITRFDGIDGYLLSGCAGNYSQAIMFGTNKDASMLGFQLYGAGDNTCQTYEVKAYLTNAETDEMIEGSKVALMSKSHSHSDSKTYDVEFENPIRLSKEEKYLLIVNIKGPASHYGQSGKTSVQHGSFVCSFYNYQKYQQSNSQITTTYGKHGQIPGLMFLV